MTESIILGIDPGTQVMGYALLKYKPQNPQLQVLWMDVLKMHASQDNYERLFHIHNKVNEIISLYKPDCLAIEAPFFGKNVQSMLKLGRAQGVAIATAMSRGLTTTEYSPKKVKQSVTGKGNADKEQVWLMLQRILQIADKPEYFDATDALAVALCHYYQISKPVQSGQTAYKNWNDFLKHNQHKIK